MLIMKRLFCISFAILILNFISFAQTVSWVVSPGTYDQITPYGVGLYEVKKNGRAGIINDHGFEVVPVESKTITKFVEGLALVINNEGGRNRIQGIISAEGNYTKVSGGPYYTIPGQEFFSEGYLTISDQQKHAGFMSAEGEVVQLYEDDFVAPFSEGYAAVGMYENYRLVDKRFKEIEIELPTNEELAGGTNVYENEAIVWAGESKCFKYNVKNGHCKKYRCKDDTAFDYLFCLMELSHRSENIGYDDVRTAAVTAYPIKSEGKFGYKIEGKELLSCQLDEANKVLGEVAIVTLKGKVGLLKMLPKSKEFSVITSTPKFEYWKNEAKSLDHAITMVLPDEWRNEPMEVTVMDENGAPVTLNSKGSGVYSFNTPELSGQKNYKVVVESGDLILWNGQFSCSYIGKSRPEPSVSNLQTPLTIIVKMVNTTADKNNRCRVVATVHNSNSQSVTAKITFRGSELLNASSVSVTIPAHSSKEVETYFNVKKVAKGQYVSVTSSTGGSATLKNLQLIPF